jgi:hypothetical protein
MALCIGSFGLLACGGGGGDNPDSGLAICGNGICEGTEATDCPADCTGGADAGAACNAVANTGCAGGEKCTYIIESTEPLLGRTDCAADGTMAGGAACTDAFTAEGGVDDCVGGYFCNDAVCQAICDTLENTNCADNETCVPFNGIFEDANNVGICQPGCNPVADLVGGELNTGCATEEGCYISTVTGRGSCSGDCRANPACDAGFTGSNTVGSNNCADAGWGTQHCNCECLNCCSPGYGCLLNNDPDAATGSVCAAFCDTTAGGGPDCSGGAPNGIPNQLTANSCRQIATFYNNTDQVPPEVGMCVDGTVWMCYGCVDETQAGCGPDLADGDCDCDPATCDMAGTLCDPASPWCP